MSGQHKTHGTRNRISKLAGMALPIVLACGQATAIDIDLGIENDAEYAQMVSAMRAAEYVRSDVIVAANGKPRVYAAVAGLMAFAERNPQATGSQLEEFLNQYDAALRGTDQGDPDLNRGETFHAALRFARVNDDLFPGMDTDIGKRASELIGTLIPDPDGFESIQRRMVRYESALATSLNHNSDIFSMLVAGFFGVDVTGLERPDLPLILDAYFASEGFDAALGSTRPDLPDVDAGLAALPADYAAYLAAIEMGSANDALRGLIENELQFLQDRLTQIVAEINATPDVPIMQETLDLTPAEVQAQIDALLLELQETTEARALASAASFIMLQSEFEQIEGFGEYALDFSSIQLQTNDTFSYLQGSTSLVSNLSQTYLQFGQDPAGSLEAAFGAVEDVFGLFGLGFGGPSVDEQIFDQVLELRQQVEDMRVEMNARFDRIDEQLDIMFNTIVFGFDQIGDQIGDLQEDVSSIILDIAAANSQLRRIEAALYGVAQDILLTDLTNEANIVLDYRDENGIDLPYSGGSPDFITASESFFTYSTVTSLSEAFAGSRTNPSVTLGTADDLLGNGPVAGSINDLAVLPLSLGVSALTNSDLPGIEPWTQAASAYAQLARENPWYFNFRYGTQLADFNADPLNESMPELDRIIRSGDQIVDFVESIRETDANGDSELFGALIQNYRDAVSGLQSEIDARITDLTPSELKSADESVVLDFWGDDTQDIEAALDQARVLVTRNDGSTYFVDFESGVVDRGYRMFTPPGGAGVEAIQIWALLQEADPSSNIRLWGEIDRSTSQFGQGTADVWLGTPNRSEIAHRRLNRYTGYVRLFSGFPWTFIFIDTEAKAEQVFTEGWVGSGLQAVFPVHKETTPVGSQWTTSTGRADVESQFTFNDPAMVRTRTSQAFFDYRSNTIIPTLLTELLDPSTPLAIAAKELDNAEALLDAYVTLGMPEELNDRDVLRSALRAAPGTSEFGLRAFDVITLIDDTWAADSPANWADEAFSVRSVDDILNSRIDVVENEIRLGLERPAAAPGYVGWMLTELKHLRGTAFDLAVDDTYTAEPGGAVTASVGDGLLSNDNDQGFRVIEIDTLYEFDPVYVAPANGSLTLNADGSFDYQADPGFFGTDSFTYRSMTTIPGVAAPVFSEPATVVVIVPESGCSPADLAVPFGTLNFFDLGEFLGLFGTQDPAADLAAPSGVWNFFDLGEFLNLFGQGCP